MNAAKAFGRKATGSLRKSGSGFALNTVRSPLTGGLGGVSDASKIYKTLRPKGYKLPGTRKVGSLGSKLASGLRRGGSLLGVG
jgi:hypothetical protein